MTRHLLAVTTIGTLLAIAAPRTARADEIDACANAYETAQRHHKAGELKASIVDAQTCARDVCPEILKKDCSSWLTTWRAEERAAEPKPKSASKPEPKSEPKSESKSKPVPQEEPSHSGPSRPVPIVTYVLAGVGVVSLGVATGFMLNGVNVRKDLDRQECAPSCDSAQVDRARTSLLVADIFGIAGAAAIGGALVIYLTRPEANGSAKTGSLSITPAVTRASAGASLQATF